MSELSRLVDKVALKDENGDTVSMWYNEDIRPLPPHRRTWTAVTFFTYQTSVGIIIAAWSAGASLFNFGLNAWQCILAVMIGFFCVGLFTMVGAHIGGKWHIGFPVASRVAWGMRAGVFPVLNRTVLNCTWFAIESWFGSMCTKVTIGAIWPQFYTMKNTLPASVPMETNDFIAWLLFTTFCLAGVMVKPEKYHWFGVIVSGSVFIVAIAMLGWFVSQAGGAGELFQNTAALTGVKAASGSQFSWMFVRAITTIISSQATGVIGYADWGRYAKTPGAQRYSQGLGIGISNMFTAIIGIICASCAATIYPDAGLVWNPALLLEQIQEHSSSAARAAVFFASIPLLGSQFMITVTGAGIAGGIDLSGVFPKFLNIRRGTYLVCIIGILMQPWQMANSSSKFVSVMGAYAVFLAPLTAILHCDFYLVRKQRLSLVELYVPNSTSSYWYWKGVNWRAMVSFAVGIFAFVPGFVHAVTPGIKISTGWSRLYYMSYFMEYLITATIYYILNLIFPVPGIGKIDEYDTFGTFSPGEKAPFGIIVGVAPDSHDIESRETTTETDSRNKKATEAMTVVEPLT